MTHSNWSVPETEVLRTVHKQLEANQPAALATIVDVEGNAYRRPGAKMLLTPDGKGVGSITAGCLEDDLLRVGRAVREEGRPRIETYDLMEDEDDVWGLGVGCNGVIEVLLEPLVESYRPAVEAFADGRDIASLTVLESDLARLKRGDRAYFRPGWGGFEHETGEYPAWLTDAMADPATELARRGRADTLTTERPGGRVRIFVDGIAAPTDLYIFGSGHDVGPVTELAALNDLRVTVIGFRSGVDLDERFPSAARTVTTSPGSLRETLDLDDQSHAIVMSHNFVDDRLAIDELLGSPAPYVGLMGPRDRFEEMIAVFESEGRTFDDEERDRLYTPVGIDLGGGSPYQIAHSIVGEVLAVSNGRRPGHLKTREGPIHDRPDISAE